jgi:hypothetical protein
LKRDRTPREIVAQALDYGSWVAELTADRIVQIYGRFSRGTARRARPGAALPTSNGTRAPPRECIKCITNSCARTCAKNALAPVAHAYRPQPPHKQQCPALQGIAPCHAGWHRSITWG